MKRNSLVLLFIVCVALCACSLKRPEGNNAANTNVGNTNADTLSADSSADSSTELQGASAEALVADLYKQHDANKSPFFQTTDRARADRYFAKPTADLIWKDSVSSKNEIGAIDFDALYDAQDVEKKNFAIGKAEVNGESATVVASFMNYGEKKRITFVLKMAGGNWKIDDIRYQAGHTLLGLLRETYGSGKNNVPTVQNVSGEFDGTYRVGETTCTVKPVKMAFEVRWAKGSGTETFVFRSGNAFDSDDGNSFEFDDENYNSGTFYRADGKSFSVKRSK